MPQSLELCFPSDHPTSAGHFPSNPIMPGALILDTVIRAVVPDAARAALVVRTVKFIRPVRPGERFHLRWEATAAGAISFDCRLSDGGDLAVAGALEFRAKQE